MQHKKIMIREKRGETVGIRLNKYLSDSGVCSRREADRLIESGQVSVNGTTAMMGQRVFETDEVVCQGKKLQIIEKLELIAYHKPVGVECTTDRSNPDNVIDHVRYPGKLFYVGRLDKNSCGLLLLTNDGDLSNRIAKAVNGHEKEYIVTVDKKITEKFINRMSQGVHILNTVTRKCRVKKIDEYNFSIILTQGLNRQIRRMCQVFSYQVVHLKRIRVMNIKLGDLKEGEYRRVTDRELDELLDSCDRLRREKR